MVRNNFIKLKGKINFFLIKKLMGKILIHIKVLKFGRNDKISTRTRFLEMGSCIAASLLCLPSTGFQCWLDLHYILAAFPLTSAKRCCTKGKMLICIRHSLFCHLSTVQLSIVWLVATFLSRSIHIEYGVCYTVCIL